MKEGKKIVEALIPTEWGDFRMIAYGSDSGQYVPHLALVHPEFDANSIVTVRIHSECITGDLFHSKKCDCGRQLQASLEIIAKEKGILIYLRQEGRGIGLVNKLKAYNIQEQGMDTIEANLALGLEIDSRQYKLGISILEDLGIERIKLLTNNPDKVNAFEGSRVMVEKRTPLEIKANDNNREYLRTKQDSLGHFLNVK